MRALEFLKRLRTTGMPIREMQRYIALYHSGDNTLAERRRILEEHRCQVRRHVEELQSCLEALEYKINNYACLEVGLIELNAKGMKK
jgi:DNA-binding transcriptional MerR regulator